VIEKERGEELRAHLEKEARLEKIRREELAMAEKSRALLDADEEQRQYRDAVDR
jgi:hypothetical protein